MRSLGILLAIIGTFNTELAYGQQAPSILGSGKMECSEWIKTREAGGRSGPMADWILGFLSGAQFGEGTSFHRELINWNTDKLLREIDKTCQDAPSMPLWQAAVILATVINVGDLVERAH